MLGFLMNKPFILLLFSLFIIFKHLCMILFIVFLLSSLKSVIYHFRGNREFARLRIGKFDTSHHFVSFLDSLYNLNYFHIILRNWEASGSNGSQSFLVTEVQCNFSRASKLVFENKLDEF